MTLQELIKHYKNRIDAATDKKAVTAKIIKEIDKLTYSSNNRPINVEDKKKILVELQRAFFAESFLCHAQDNNEHLILISQAIKMLGGK